MTEPDPLEIAWQRLDRRMLVVQPLRALKDFLPVIIGALIFGGGAGDWWQALAVVGPIVWGVLRYLSTTFRITQGRLELRTGIVNRQRRSTPLDRIRSVDLTAHLLHRMLGLTAMRIGTGTSSIGEDELHLDGLSVATAERLRAELIRRREPIPSLPESGAVGEPEVSAQQHDPDDPGEVVARLDPRWARFAPLTTVGLLAPLALVGGAFHLIEQTGLDDRVADRADVRVGLWLAVLLGAVAVLILAIVVPIGGYLLANWGFTLRRERDAWSVSRGLLTTRRTHLDRDRVAGIEIGEALPVRVAGGAKVDAIATGTRLLAEDSMALLPMAPATVAHVVAAEVVGTPDPVEIALTPHGPAATRRRWIRALVPAALVVVASVVAVIVLDLWPWWPVVVTAVAVPVAALLAVDRSRALGHALTAGHLVVRSGSLTRSREILDTGQVIGWTFTSTWFQRRVGLVDFTATTAGGEQYVSVPDVPKEAAVDLADAALPGLAAQFLVGADLR